MNGSEGMDGRKEKGKKRRDAISLKHVPRDLVHLPKGSPTHASNVKRYPHIFIRGTRRDPFISYFEPAPRAVDRGRGRWDCGCPQEI